MGKLICIFALCLLIQVSIAKEERKSPKEEAPLKDLPLAREEYNDDEDLELTSLSIHENPDTPIWIEERAPFPTYSPGLPPGNHPLLLGSVLINNVPPYAPNTKLRWRFRTSDPGAVAMVQCRTRIVTSPKCNENRLTLFTGKGFNTGTAFCGWHDNIFYVSNRRVKIVFRSGPNPIVNSGFSCSVEGV